MENKNIIVVLEEFKTEFTKNLNDLIEKHKLPMYFVNEVIKGVYTQTNEAASVEYAQIKDKEEKDVKDKE